MNKNFLLAGLAIAIHLLFRNENAGANCLIFNILAIIFLYVQHKDFFVIKEMLLPITISLIASVGVILSNSDLAIAMHLVTMMVLVGVAHHPQVRWALTAWFYSLSAWISAPKMILGGVDTSVFTAEHAKKTNKFFTYSWVSACIIPIFFTIYYFANDGFAQLCNHVCRVISEVLATVSFEWSFWGLIFWIICIFTAALLLFRAEWLSIVEQEQNFSDTNERYRSILRDLFLVKRTDLVVPSFSPLALLTQYRTAVVLFSSLNALILLVNCSDIWAVWLHGRQSILPSEFSSDLHDGTFTLIFSILLAMGLVAYFFHKNLNFYTKNAFLKALVYGWTVQNSFLAASVFMRNLQYICAYGLAYNRIGVLVFLVLVLIGLFTMLLKIKYKKTIFYLLRINSWAMLFILSAVACFSWDNIITDYNTKSYSYNKIDWYFLICDVSYQNIPQLWQQRKRMSPPIRRFFTEKMQTYQLIATCNDCTYFSYNIPDENLKLFFRTNKTAIDDWYKNGSNKNEQNIEKTYN
ncbi:MAG: hypothetical protein RI894_1526 [Bacteroidota bacterium]|jgi:hypothetical protein